MHACMYAPNDRRKRGREGGREGVKVGNEDPNHAPGVLLVRALSSRFMTTTNHAEQRLKVTFARGVR